MVANSIIPKRRGKLGGSKLGPGRVIILSDRYSRVAPSSRAAGLAEGACAAILQFGLRFTAADYAALAAWASDTGHGYERVHVERDELEAGHWVNYALVYVPGEAWSTWGVTRINSHVEVWRCATGETLGRHAQMADALASLPHAADLRRALPMNAGRVGMWVGSRRHGTR